MVGEETAERVEEQMSKEVNERFTSDEKGNILDDGEILTVEEILKYMNWYRRDMLKLSIENEKLRKEKMEANAFIVEKGLEVEFIRWCRE